MVFNSIAFLVFFCLVFALYWGFLSERLSLRNAFLLVASYFFYAYWDWRFLLLIVFSSAVDFQVGKCLEGTQNTHTRRSLLILSLCTNLGMLGFFKYYNFFIDSAQALLSQLGVGWNSGSLEIILPVGISFYTFQTLSYTIDVYRKKISATNSALDFCLFRRICGYFPELNSDFVPLH